MLFAFQPPLAEKVRGEVENYKMKITIGIIVAAIIGLAVGVGIRYIYPTSDVVTTEERRRIISTSEGEGIRVRTDIEATVTTTVDCGDKNCFDEKFAACEPATLTASAPPLGTAAYEILGAGTGGCRVTFKYTENPNPDWVNKEMTCTVDNSKDFQGAFDEVFPGVFQGNSQVCSGPFVDLF